MFDCELKETPLMGLLLVAWTAVAHHSMQLMGVGESCTGSWGWSASGVAHASSSAACSVGARGPELGRPSAAAEAPGIVVHGEGRPFDQHIFLIGSRHPGVSALPQSRLLLHLS